MKIPTIHLNGTSAERLREGYGEAYTAISQAIDKLCACRPNGRDYYVQESGAFYAAADEHQKRIDALRGVQKELEQLIGGIDEQETSRQR